jgi:hypothetical protein
VKAIYRYEVPVDDLAHRLMVAGPVLAVGCRRPDVVEFWALHDSAVTWYRWFQVFGTGQTLPEVVKYLGTAVAPGGQLVWHLLEMDGRNS